jgi:RNA polymerase sigma-70 factor (ECF subfamily)
LSDDADASLLARTAAGDASAFTAFVRRHEARVYRYALLLAGQRADAEDALQETFLRAWRHAAQFRGPGAATGWLLAIARSAVARQRRRHAGEPVAHESLDVLAEQAGWGASVDGGAAEDAVARVQRALARLGAGDREILALRDLEGRSGEATAEALGITLAAMKTRLHRARLRFAAAWRAEAE